LLREKILTKNKKKKYAPKKSIAAIQINHTFHKMNLGDLASYFQTSVSNGLSKEKPVNCSPKTAQINI
jgi:hypothetical protein